MTKTVTLFIADTHNGSTTGLMTRGQWKGASYSDPTPLQKIIRAQLDEGIAKALDVRKHGYRLFVVVAGDAVDGWHHNTIELVTPDVSEQERMHVDCMLGVLDTLKFRPKRGDELFYVEGTEVHTGKSEERIARDIQGVTPVRPKTKGDDGQYVWPRLLLNVNGVVHDIAHHGGKVGKREWTKENTLSSILKNIYFEGLEHNRKPPRYWIRANEHRHVTDEYSGEHGKITGIVLPALQLRTRYAHSVAGDSAMSTIGTAFTVVEDDGSTWWECNKLTFDESAEKEVVR
jgi:hypothetical protein